MVATFRRTVVVFFSSPLIIKTMKQQTSTTTFNEVRDILKEIAKSQQEAARRLG